MYETVGGAEADDEAPGRCCPVAAIKYDAEVGGGRLVLLPAAHAFAPSGGWGCCQRRTNMLQVPAALRATKDGRPCYQQTATLLPTAGDLATRAGGLATKVWRPCCQGAAALRPRSGKPATIGDRHCYKVRPTLLPWHDGVAASAVDIATEARRGCYKGRSSLLLWTISVAARPSQAVASSSGSPTTVVAGGGGAPAFTYE
ncbi:hypothetical protein QYE76_016107 [Lolium multiflorum]|uniref:Uncharacterized protein n=1 Tax=Lolium multiflorum TaxID=4521 RepID=A0AAD8X8D1_LOLMU|nr:hypothetical protein QYE76_016107 [Lolium multiflorum]